MTREEVEIRDEIALDFTNKWKYRYDKEQYGSSDAWVIIRSESEEGKFEGDCEDYALSLLWRLSDKKDWKMWWMLLTRQAGICAVGSSKTKITHAVLRYKGEYIDNWTRKFGSKQEIEKNHTFHWLYGHGLLHFTIIKMVMSKITRTIKGDNR